MKLNETQSDGLSTREHLASVEKITGRKPKELEELIELPNEFKKVWEDFICLSSSRPSGFGISPISYTEIMNYSILMGVEFEPWEVQVIKIFDRVTIEEINKQNKKQSKN